MPDAPQHIPATLTDARLISKVHVVVAGADRNESNVRTVPYVDIYRQRNSVMETPESRLSRAAEPVTEEIESRV